MSDELSHSDAHFLGTLAYWKREAVLAATIEANEGDPGEGELAGSIDNSRGCAVFELPLPFPLLDPEMRASVQMDVMLGLRNGTDSQPDDFDVVCTPTRIIAVIPDDGEKGHELMIARLAEERGEMSLIALVDSAIEDAQHRKLDDIERW